MSGGGTVVFSYTTWIARYPEFSSVAESTAQLYFAEATLYLSNTPTSIVQDLGQRALLLNMLVAHIAQLNSPSASGEAASPLVGRIASASEGSVSVSTDYGTQSELAAWFNQTKYGAAYYRATANRRTARLVRARGCGGWR